MKLVVKIGGAAIDDKSILKKCAHSIAELANRGSSVAVVHGGGKALTRTLEQLGKRSEFINGLRVTDLETRDVAVMVLAGAVNKQLVATFGDEGVPAIGLCGGDGMGFLARKKEADGIDLGYVGEIRAVDSRWIEVIWGNGGIPVLSSIALGPDGEYYNVNADEMASACAAACRPDALIFLTDVAGVKDADGSIVRRLTTNEIPPLVKSSVIGGGMLPKLEACQHALRSGVARVLILPAAEADILSALPESVVQLGTEVIGDDSYRRDGEPSARTGQPVLRDTFPICSHSAVTRTAPREKVMAVLAGTKFEEKGL